MTKYLIEKGADIHAVNNRNENAIFFAAGNSCDVFKFLMEFQKISFV